MTQPSHLNGRPLRLVSSPLWHSPPPFHLLSTPLAFGICHSPISLLTACDSVTVPPSLLIVSVIFSISSLIFHYDQFPLLISALTCWADCPSRSQCM